MFKKKFNIIVIILIVILNSLVFFGCIEKYPPIEGKELFKNYDFSVDNIKEIGFAQAIVNDGGTPYGNKSVYAVKKGDERLIVLANAWINFVDKGVFTGTDEKRDIMKTGGSMTYVIIFNDGKYIDIIKIDEDIIKYGASNMLVSKDVLKDFSDSFSIIKIEDEIC